MLVRALVLFIILQYTPESCDRNVEGELCLFPGFSTKKKKEMTVSDVACSVFCVSLGVREQCRKVLNGSL